MLAKQVRQKLLLRPERSVLNGLLPASAQLHLVVVMSANKGVDSAIAVLLLLEVPVVVEEFRDLRGTPNNIIDIILFEGQTEDSAMFWEGEQFSPDSVLMLLDWYCFLTVSHKIYHVLTLNTSCTHSFFLFIALLFSFTVYSNGMQHIFCWDNVGQRVYRKSYQSSHREFSSFPNNEQVLGSRRMTIRI
jgi:hypothetical protein